ncbi:MAG TPA: glycosyltransferase [Acidimicrobiales bacterium]
MCGNRSVTKPLVSVIICTYNRAASLRNTLRALEHLAYSTFEVVVVAGPCTDQTSDVLDQYEGKIKVVLTTERNLSASRNLGIAAATGAIVAFIDDDALPDASWLDDLIEAFSDPEVAATGGCVMDHSGHRFQALYNLADRWGDFSVGLEPRRLDYLDHPDTPIFPYPMGTNSLFVRERLVEIGGFDETYAFYLDETDVCVRLIDRGYRVLPQFRGVVHHKFLPSDIRNDGRVTVDYRGVILSRVYFSIRHGLKRSNELEMAEAFSQFAKSRRADLENHVQAGRAASQSLHQFDVDVIEGWRLAHEWAAKPARTRPKRWFEERSADFLRFPTVQPYSRRLRYCIVTREYPPGTVHGIGRAHHTLATAMASEGHTVHVITASRSGHNTVDFEEGVWVHRIVSTDQGVSPVPDLPDELWNWSGSVLDELRRLDGLNRVDAVQLPNWDAEGLAVVGDRHFRSVLFAYTPILAVAASDPRIDVSHASVRAIADADRTTYELTDLVMAAFPSTFDELERLYGTQIPSWKRGLAPLGLPDLDLPPSIGSDEWVEVLFVGRLEPRKGIDTLLAAIPALCARHPQVRFTLAGDDSTPAPDGITYKEKFLSSQPPDVKQKVRFLGPIADDELIAAFARCDIFVAPSRFESFGLVNLEAMRFGKPVVSSLVNGVISVVRDGLDGILVPPDDTIALSSALSCLIDDPDLRASMGAHGRRSYEEKFTDTQMAARVAASVQALLEGVPQQRNEVVTEDLSLEIHPWTKVAADRQRLLLDALRCTQCRGLLNVISIVATEDGRVKTGTLRCPTCSVNVARIDNFQITFAEVEPISQPPDPAPTRFVGEIGEYRISGRSDEMVADGWNVHPDCWTSSELGATLTYRGPCTDVRLRLVDHQHGGSLQVIVDGRVTHVLDTRATLGSVSRIIDIQSDLELATHEIVLKVIKLEPASYVHVDELVLLAPRQSGLRFSGAAPFARANTYSERITRHLSQCDSTQLILECGGGDRRSSRPNHLNLEFLPYEGADLRADLHRLPFDDSTFDLVLSQAVFEHLANPRAVAQEMIRVCKPGGLILTEVAFMQPLHAVPYHFYNMTGWGTEELFKESCSIEESDWFGPLSFTINWIMDAAGITDKMDAVEREEWRSRLSSLDELVDHDSLKAVASGIWVVARKHEKVLDE